MNPLNDQLPAWVTLLLIPAATVLWGWWRESAFPWLQKYFDTDAHARREAAKAVADERESRFLAAFETSAKGVAGIAQTLKVLEETRVNDNLTLQRVERRLDAIEDRVGRPAPVARRRTEAERGE